jgi:hypothetical protein
MAGNLAYPVQTMEGLGGGDGRLLRELLSSSLLLAAREAHGANSTAWPSLVGARVASLGDILLFLTIKWAGRCTPIGGEVQRRTRPFELGAQEPRSISIHAVRREKIEPLRGLDGRLRLLCPGQIAGLGVAAKANEVGCSQRMYLQAQQSWQACLHLAHKNTDNYMRGIPNRDSHVQ